jgi:hypothetical protein
VLAPLAAQARDDPDGHERARVRRVRLADGAMRHAAPCEAFLETDQRDLVLDCEDDGARARRERAPGLARSMNELRGDDAEGEVPPDDAVMDQRIGISADAT